MVEQKNQAWNTKNTNIQPNKKQYLNHKKLMFQQRKQLTQSKNNKSNV